MARKTKQKRKTMPARGIRASKTGKVRKKK